MNSNRRADDPILADLVRALRPAMCAGHFNYLSTNVRRDAADSPLAIAGMLQILRDPNHDAALTPAQAHDLIIALVQRAAAAEIVSRDMMARCAAAEAATRAVQQQLHRTEADRETLACAASDFIAARATEAPPLLQALEAAVSAIWPAIIETRRGAPATTGYVSLLGEVGRGPRPGAETTEQAVDRFFDESQRALVRDAELGNPR